MEELAIWSNTDYPYMCLKDRARTEAFRNAIRRAVRPGDTVVEVGAGTGILSFFAAQAGASRVLAVEYDALLASVLQRSIAANGLEEIVEVIQGNAMDVGLPRGANVVISEMIDTALIDEMQVPVLNRLHRDEVIVEGTVVVPSGYVTTARLANVSTTYYGCEILAPKHLWPFYRGNAWHQTDVLPVSSVWTIATDDFAAAPLEEDIDLLWTLDGLHSPGANSVVLTGLVCFEDGSVLGATPALNGAKAILLRERIVGDRAGEVTVRLSYRRGGGLASFRCESEIDNDSYTEPDG